MRIARASLWGQTSRLISGLLDRRWQGVTIAPDRRFMARAYASFGVVRQEAVFNGTQWEGDIALAATLNMLMTKEQ